MGSTRLPRSTPTPTWRKVSRSTGTRWRRATSAWAATARRVRARTTLSWSARRASRRPGAKPFGCGHYHVQIELNCASKKKKKKKKKKGEIKKKKKKKKKKS